MKDKYILALIVASILILTVAIPGCTTQENSGDQAQANFKYNNLEVSPSEVKTGENVTISVNVENTGGEQGTKTVEFTIGEETKTEDVTLSAGDTTTVSVTISKDSTGTYDVSVADMSDIFSVIETGTADFQVTNLEVNPSEVKPGEKVEVSMNIRNIGNKRGEYTAKILVDGKVEHSRTLELSAGEMKPLILNVSREEVGTYKIEIENLSESFNVTKPKEARFSVNNLVINVSKVELSKNVIITAEIENVGNEEGTYNAELLVNGDIEKSETVELSAKETKSISFQVSRDEVGTYVVELANLSETLEVVEPARFEVSNLNVNPSKVRSNKTIEISVDVKNIGGIQGTHTVKLEVNGKVEKTKTIELGDGKSTKVSFELSKQNPGTYDLRIENLSNSFRVLKPAELAYTNLQVKPSKVIVDELIEVSVEVKNIGDVATEKEIVLEANGSYLDSETISLGSGETREVTFTTYSSEPGLFNLSIGNLSKTIEVESLVSTATHASVFTITDNWDKDAEDDGIIVSPLLKNATDQIVEFEGIEMNVSIEIWTTKYNEDYDEVKDRLIYEGEDTVTNWYGSGSEIKVPFSEIDATPSDDQYGMILVTIHTPNHGDFEAKSTLVQIKR